MRDYSLAAAAIRLSLAAVVVAIVPALASAQAIAGVVRDASGAVLPGVTVEATSPALIEKVRTAVTDGAGQFRLDSLVAGVYSVTYTLPGFATVQRTLVELQTGITLTLNAELRVGGLEETITVVGETPVVDVQNSTRVQTVLSDEVLAALPASRGYGNLLAVSAGVQANGTQNGGVNPGMIFFTSRGGRSNEGTVQIDGMNVGSAFNGGGVAGYGYDTTNAQEVQLTVAGGLGEADRGGPQFNIIPKTGGNTFSGTYFGNLAGSWSQSNNVDDELKSYGIPVPTKIIKNWDTSFAMGGPIKRDRVWFYATARTIGEYTDIAGRFGNLNAGDPAKWNYVADQSITSRTVGSRKVVGGRVTTQLSAQEQGQRLLQHADRLQRQLVRQRRAMPGARRGLGGSLRVRRVVAGVHADAGRRRAHHAVRVHGADDQQAPARSGLLAVLQQLEPDRAGRRAGPGAIHPGAGAGSFRRRAGAQHGLPRLRRAEQQPPDTQRVARGAVLRHRRAQHESGLRGGLRGDRHLRRLPDARPAVRFLGGVPNQITQRIHKWQQANRTRYDAFYVQDQWTRNRLTLQGALRYENARSFFPEGMNGLLTDSRFGGPARTLPSAKGVDSYNDFAPRMGLAYDVFGNGKTAIKANLSKYWQYAANDGVYIRTNLASTFAQTANRAWNDTNRDFVPQCDLNVAAANGECGGLDNQNFFALRDSGSVRSTASVVSPELLGGWNVRPFDWQFGVSVQQQVLPRLSVEIGYSRRSWGNLTFQDNRAMGPADFDQYRFTVPNDPRLATAARR